MSEKTDIEGQGCNKPELMDDMDSRPPPSAFKPDPNGYLPPWLAPVEAPADQ